MTSLKGRLRHLEEPGRCRECRLSVEGTIVCYEGEEPPEPKRCPSCGRPLEHVIRVVYEGEEGEGGLLDQYMHGN